MVLSSERWQRLESLFYEAIALRPKEREAFLVERCAGDEAMRREAESLLASLDHPLDLLEKPIRNAASEVVTGRNAPARKAGALFGRYEIIRPIGAGGMGRVCLARDRQLRRQVALKFLAPLLTRDQRSLERFEHEALAASALNHPDIVTVYEFGQVDAEYYLASEYVEGETLRQRLRRSRLGLTEVTDISIQIASALAAAHAQGIVHRDIKPDNLILRSDSIVKLLDFGIAKLNLSAVEGEDGERLLHTLLSTNRTGQVVGTARYMSPEQARGKELDGRSDLFSLGAVMYEMATGRHAFRGDTANEIIAEILKEEPTPLSEAVPHIDPSFEAIVTRMLRKDRDQRYPSAAAMLADLQEFRKEIEFQEKLKVAGRSGSITLNALDPKFWVSAVPSVSPAGFRRAVSAIRTQWRESSIIAIAVIAALLATALVATPLLRQRWQRSPTVAAPRTLAVLPFRNLRPESQTDFLGFSLADAIVTKLGVVKELTVRPSSSVEKFRNQAVAPQMAARELHVDTLLTGTFVRDGDDLRITAQLIDVKPEKILWQDTIDLKYNRLLTVQDTVAERVLNGLEVELSPEEKAKLQPEQTVKPGAYEYYLRGVDLYSLNNFPAAIEMLQKAAGLDPNYAPIWAHLGRAYTTNATLQFGGREQYAKAQAAYEKAMALDPGMVDVRVYLANLLTDTGRVEQAVPLMRDVLAKDSN